MPDEFFRSYNGFSGVDVTAYLPITPRQRYAKVQAISFSKTRGMAPIFKEFAEPEVIGIAGSLIFYDEFYIPEPVSVFDVELVRADKDGRRCTMNIIGVEILVEGFAWDMDKMFEASEQYTYIATSILPWRWSNGKELTTGTRVQEKCF